MAENRVYRTGAEFLGTAGARDRIRNLLRSCGNNNNSFAGLKLSSSKLFDLRLRLARMIKLDWLMRKENNLRAEKSAGTTGTGEADSGARAASHQKTCKTASNWLSHGRSAVELSSSGTEGFTVLALKVQ